MPRCKHGKHEASEYVSWEGMMGRCYNPNHHNFKWYGGRGIVVCDRWHEAGNFLEDMGERPSPEYTLGRIDNDKGYEPENCRWETITEQNRNNRTTKLTLAEAREIRMLHARGYMQTELAKEFGISKTAVWYVIHNHTWRED